MHHRLAPKVHRFHYNVFMFYVDLDELDTLSKKLFFFSRNRFNLFSFKDKEHLQLPKENPDTSKPVKEHIITYLKEQGFNYTNQRIMLLTNMSVLGYNFNPVSFYFIVNEANEPQCAIAEVGNTFGEQKPFFLSKETLSNNVFELQATKHFYVSPFISHDSQFVFSLGVPSEKMNIRINTHTPANERFFITTLTGKQTALTNGKLLLYFLKFPFITIKIITLIHWNALLLWLKKIPYFKKGDFKELQKDVYKRNLNY
jgi:uncharacterized protein